MIRSIGAVLVGAFRRAALPLGWYYAVTIVLPLANGAMRTGGAFVRHALAVFVVPPMVILLTCLVQTGVQLFASGWRVTSHVIAHNPGDRSGTRPCRAEKCGPVSEGLAARLGRNGCVR